MNVARARRRWRKWYRYLDYMIRLSEHTVCSRGMMKAYNQRVRWDNRKIRRRERGETT